MTPVSATALDGARVTLGSDSVEDFAARLRGPLLAEGDTGYDEARTIWNGMIDERPTLVARCSGTADVIHAVRFAREHGLLTAIRGGGHNVAGNAVCEGGLMIDLSAMDGVHVDPAERTVRVVGAPPGATSTTRPRSTGWRRRAAWSRPPAWPASRWAAAWGGCGGSTGSPATTSSRPTW